MSEMDEDERDVVLLINAGHIASAAIQRRNEIEADDISVMQAASIMAVWVARKNDLEIGPLLDQMRSATEQFYKDSGDAFLQALDTDAKAEEEHKTPPEWTQKVDKLAFAWQLSQRLMLAAAGVAGGTGVVVRCIGILAAFVASRGKDLDQVFAAARKVANVCLENIEAAPNKDTSH